MFNRNNIMWILMLILLLGLAFSKYFSSLLSNASEYTENKKTELTVLDFGAVGDGIVADTEAIQQAVDSGIGYVCFPKGIYRITKTILIELDRSGPIAIEGSGGTARIFMKGAGPAIKFLGTHKTSTSIHTENIMQNERMPTVNGLEIVGEHPEAVGIEVNRTMQATITRVLVRRCLHGIHLTNRNRNVIISECHVYHNKGTGIFLDKVNLHQINITNCHISYNGGGGVVVRSGEVRNLQICGCDIEGNMNPDGPPTANVFLDYSKGNSVGEGTIAGCTIQHTRNSPNSANIRFIGSNFGDEPNVKNFTIADNVLSDVGINIHLKYARGITITGNTLWRGYSLDILAENSTNIVMGPNIFDRNPSYNDRRDKNTCLRGIVFRDCSDCLISGVQIKNALDKRGGLILERCYRFNITDCSIYNCEGPGILLDDVEHVRVSDCMILYYPLIYGKKEKKTIAIKLTKGRYNMITDNQFKGEVEIAPGSAYIESNYMIQ